MAKSTPIPSRAIEFSSKGPSGVREYTLSPEELEEIRQKYPATKADKTFKKPVEIKTQTKEEKEMAKFKMTAEEYFAERQAGKSQEQIASEHGITPQAIDYHMKKWESESKPGGMPLLREKDSAPKITDSNLLDKAEREIERLTAEVEHWKALTREADRGSLKTIEDLRIERDTREKELLDVQAELNRVITERDELVTENDRLECRMVEAQGEATRAWSEVEGLREATGQPIVPVAEIPSETKLLDRSIAELTRARWIIGRLTAAGE